MDRWRVQNRGGVSKKDEGMKCNCGWSFGESTKGHTFTHCVLIFFFLREKEKKPVWVNDNFRCCWSHSFTWLNAPSFQDNTHCTNQNKKKTPHTKVLSPHDLWNTTKKKRKSSHKHKEACFSEQRRRSQLNSPTKKTFGEKRGKHIRQLYCSLTAIFKTNFNK